MKVGLFLAFLIFTAQSTTYFRLNTNENTKLSPGDTLISTMGLYSATLLQNLCMLSISSFNGNNGYTKVGNYTSPNATGNCNYLTITDGQIVTDSNSTYMYVGPTYNLSTIFTIDDYGVMRLIGTYQLPDYVNQVSQEFNVTGNYIQNQTFIFPTTNMNIGFINSFPTVNNLNKWQFIASMGQLDISQYDNSGIIISYSYANININNSQINDFNSNTFPGAIFPNISFYPRCYQPRLYLNYKPPYVLVFDPYWPKASVYQQGRYKILELYYSKVYQPYAWQQNRRLFSRKEASVCPPFTFEFKGNCTPVCPYPYYYELRGQNGYCVLTCQQFTPKNQTTRICSCYSNYQSLPLSINTIRSCPDNSTTYPYGCYCNATNLYFDRLLTLSCVATCPNTTFASNGLCMSCPSQCLTCQIDGLFRAYLQCKVCKTGYIVAKGQCYSSCSPGLGLSLVQGICTPCSDPNCLNCSSNVAVCTRCNPLFAVSNGACLQTCDNQSSVAYYDKINSICLPLDSTCSDVMPTFYKTTPMLKCNKCQNGLISYLNKCVKACPTNFTVNSNNFCFCSNSGTFLVNDQCLSLPTCPIRLGWDPVSSSCLACTFGCLTCYDLECTSCVPGYFLYISPQGVRCRKKSPLFPCDQQYSWINGACLLTVYSNPLYRLTKCLASITNCMACYPNSNTDCSICSPGYYNVNNTCLSACPNGTIPYEGLTCILTQIVNCSLPYLQLKSDAFILNYDKIANSNPYLYYLFNGQQWSNDPVGYIEYYQNLTQRINDGMFRDTQFYYPTWTCLKCNDGYGMNPNFTICLPCPNPCLTCYMALNNSCLTLHSVIPTGCQYYIDYNTNQCIQNCSQSNVIPYVLNGILYCYPINKAPTQSISVIDSSAFTAADGSTNVFFVLDHPLTSGQSVPLKITTNNEVKLMLGSNDTTSPPTNTQDVVLNSAGYVYYNDPNPNNNVWILDARGNLQNTVGSSGITLSNTQYGIKLNQGYNDFRKTWLAFIGYIMGIVLICLHVVYIGNDLIYKVDNTLILAQSIYFFSFVQLLVGKLLSQFYYGWLFSHFGFFPNFFVNTIPSNYIELAAPNSYKLNLGDANIVRNAGWAFSLLLVFLVAYAVITFLCWLIKSVCHKPDVWHPRIAMNSLIGFVQFISFTIFYWAVANLLYIGDSDLLSPSFNKSSESVSIVFIVLITIYSLIRWAFNPLGGLYMVKRILIATILAASYMDNRMLAPLIILEIIFFIFRFILEKPDKTRLIFMIIIQSLLHIATYLLLFLVLDAGTNTVIISIIIFIMIVVLSYGLTNLYLQSQNEWQVEEKQEQSEESIARAEADKKVSKVQKY